MYVRMPASANCCFVVKQTGNNVSKQPAVSVLSFLTSVGIHTPDYTRLYGIATLIIAKSTIS